MADDVKQLLSSLDDIDDMMETVSSAAVRRFRNGPKSAESYLLCFASVGCPGRFTWQPYR